MPAIARTMTTKHDHGISSRALGALPKSAHPGAKNVLTEIWNAEDKDKARKACAVPELAH